MRLAQSHDEVKDDEFVGSSFRLHVARVGTFLASNEDA